MPFALAIAYAFSDVTVGDQSIDWVGLSNFRDVWNNHTFQTALRNSFLFAFVSQVIVIVLANILAMVLVQRFPRQAAGAVPGSAAVDHADRAGGHRLAVDAGQCLQPDRRVRCEKLACSDPEPIWVPGKNMLCLAKEDLAQAFSA